MPKLTFTKDMKREVLYHFPEGASKAGSAPTPVLFVDLDHTIIQPKGGRVHPKGADDWEYLYPGVISILQSAIEDGYLIYVISNQSSLLEEKKKEKLAEMIEKLNAVFAPIVHDSSGSHAKSLYIGVACSGNYYRKPHTGLFRLLEEEGGVKVDLRRSLFCGDALGRTAKESDFGKADFSASDYYFALNCGIPRVYTPKAFFKDDASTGPKGPSFAERLATIAPYEPAPRVLKRDFMDKFEAAETKKKRDEMIVEVKGMVEGAQVMIVLTGSPASGKSTLVKLLCSAIPSLACYSGDELKTRLEKSVKDGLKAGKSVLIDSTNPSKESRKKWIDMAKASGSTPISVYIPYDEEMTHHLQHFRIEESEGAVEALPEIAIRVFKSKYERPYKIEGFEAVFDYTPYITLGSSKGGKKSKQEENFHKYY